MEDEAGGPHHLSIPAAGAAIRFGSLTSESLTRSVLDRVAKFDAQIHAFTFVDEEIALTRACAADRELRTGLDRGPLHGIPYGLKDIYDAAGLPTSCNSRLAAGHMPAEDSTVEQSLKRAGAVLIGKLNTAEFALGGGEDLPVPSARNPWNIDHFSGTSSNGSGAAVAAEYLRFAMGSDTGGSIRSPAFHCGVVGLKPTYGAVSRRGVYPLSYSLDHCGPLAGSVEEVALVMNAVAGHDPLDPASAAFMAPDYAREMGEPIDGIRVGYARRFFASTPGISTEVVGSIDTAAQLLGNLGADVNEVDLPDFELFKACSRVIMLAEAFTIHEQHLRDSPEKFGRYTFQRIAPAAGLSAADLIQAHRLRRELLIELASNALLENDVILTASGLTPAARIDAFPDDWPPPGLTVSVHTAPFNVTGHPALALPSGLSHSGLPLGVQLVGRPFDETRLLRVAAALEAELAFAHRRPQLKIPELGRRL